MAKKRRRITEDPEEDYEFVPVEFDEREFILKDIYGTKITLAVIALSVVVGFIAASLVQINDGEFWWGGMVLAFIMVGSMNKLFKMVGAHGGSMYMLDRSLGSRE